MSFLLRFLFLSFFPLYAAVAPVQVIVSSDNALYDEALSGVLFTSESVDVHYLDIIELEQKGMRNWLEEKKTEGAEVVITLGDKAALTFAPESDVLPVVFTMATDSKKIYESGENTCGIDMSVSLAYLLAALNEIKPSARYVWSYTSTQKASSFVHEADYFDIKFGLLFRSKKVKNKKELLNALAQDKDKMDAFLLPADPLYNQENFQLVSSFAKENGIILIVTFEPLVRAGATYAVTPDYPALGERAAKMAERIRSGSNCESEFILVPERTRFALNSVYATEQGLSIPPNIVQRDRLSRLFAFGISLYKQEKYKSAKKVFEKILEEDENYQGAQEYYNRTVNHLTGDRVESFEKKAIALEKAQRYREAEKVYLEILRLNPGAKKYERALHSVKEKESDSLFEQGKEAEDKGKSFEALRYYLRSLDAFPENLQARDQLQHLRARERNKMQLYLQTGIEKYNARDYTTSIQIFENVLLVVPGNTEAHEYLNLSRKKKHAIERLRRMQ